MDIKNWSKYVLEMVETRVDKNLSYSGLYKKLFDIKISDDNARKRLTGIKNYIHSESNHIEKDDLNSLESFEMKENGSHIISRIVKASEEDMKSPDRVMELLGYDPMKWDLINSKHSMWNGGKEDVILYSLRCQVKPKKTKVSTKAIERLVKKLNFKHMKIPKVKCDKSGELMLEIAIPDVHFNKKSDDYNVEICKKQFLESIQYYINNVKDEKIAEVVYLVGNDFFNSDSNLNNMTTKGTIQDNDLIKHDEMFEQGTKLLIDGIELIRQQLKCKINVLYVQGNHDTLISYYSCVVIKNIYANNKDVLVDSKLVNRKYFHWGNSLIGFSHGHKEKNRLEKENIMQNERPKEWSETLFREFHLGHFHHEEVKEVGGIKYRILNSMSGIDRWHKESGYVGSIRSSQAFLWHIKKGLIKTFYYNIV